MHNAEQKPWYCCLKSALILLNLKYSHLNQAEVLCDCRASCNRELPGSFVTHPAMHPSSARINPEQVLESKIIWNITHIKKSLCCVCRQFISAWAEETKSLSNKPLSALFRMRMAMVIRVQHLAQMSAALRISFMLLYLRDVDCEVQQLNEPHSRFTCSSFVHHHSLSCRYQTPAPSPGPGKFLTSLCCADWAVGEKQRTPYPYTVLWKL